MSEGTYEYECMRAELLGIDKPEYDDFINSQKENEKKAVECDDLDTEYLKTVDVEEEGMKSISGGLDELNNILQKTQTKINNFKASCGSLTNLLKMKIAGRSASETMLDSENHPNESTEVDTTEITTTKTNLTPADIPVEQNKSENGANIRKSDLAKALDKDLSKLDDMLEKAENAQYSMAHQRNQMKKFLK